jgi:hypothetical protein
MSIKSKHWIKAASKTDCFYINDTEMSFMMMLHGWNWLHNIEGIAWRGVGGYSFGQLYRGERPGSYDSV